jgi:hypothetical protein
VRLLYLCYWGIEEGLTHATVFPQLSLLVEMAEIDSIIFCTIERNKKKVDYLGPIHDKIEFHPLYSKGLKPAVLNKILDFVVFPKTLRKIAETKHIDLILGRGTPAGALAWKVFKRTQIPFVVESFEPHADYMLESGVWKKNGLKYRSQKKWEEKQKRDAQFLITVSQNYCQQLTREGIPHEKIVTIPCTVDTQAFAFSEFARKSTRERLGLSAEAIVGVYVGKFGDIYYNHEAFQIMKAAFDFFGPSFFMLILTPQSQRHITAQIQEAGLPQDRFFIDCVPHEQIPHYLSASDFAFSFVKPSPSRKFCSPIKDGEYWANGLPILMGEDIGDDSKIIKNLAHAGFVFDTQFSNLTEAFEHIMTLISPQEREKTRSANVTLADQERGRGVISKVLKQVLQKAYD